MWFNVTFSNIFSYMVTGHRPDSKFWAAVEHPRYGQLGFFSLQSPTQVRTPEDAFNHFIIRNTPVYGSPTVWLEPATFDPQDLNATCCATAGFGTEAKCSVRKIKTYQWTVTIMWTASLIISRSGSAIDKYVIKYKYVHNWLLNVAVVFFSYFLLVMGYLPYLQSVTHRTRQVRQSLIQTKWA